MRVKFFLAYSLCKFSYLGRIIKKYIISSQDYDAMVWAAARTLVSHVSTGFQFWLPFLIWLPVDVPGKQQKMVHIAGHQSAKWKSQMEFLEPGSDLAQSQHLCRLGSRPVDTIHICLFLPFKYVFKVFQKY